jgi:hypothetical protein
MCDTVNNMAKKTEKKKNTKVQKKVSSDSGTSPEGLYKRAQEISLARKTEIEENTELTEGLCKLADFASGIFLSTIEPAIQSEDAVAKKKDLLLVLQLTYLRLCSEILEEGKKIDLSSDIPSSGYQGVEPINTEKDNVPIYI